MYDYDCGDYSNDVFLHMTNAYANAKNTRLKGYYYCKAHGEFIKAAGRKMGACPFCGKECERLLTVNSVQEQITHSIWKDCGIYSDERADLIRERRVS